MCYKRGVGGFLSHLVFPAVIMEVVYLLGFCFFACLLLLCLSSVFSFPGFVYSLMFKQYVQFHRFMCSHMMLNPVCQGSCADSRCSVQFNKVYVLTRS